MSPVNELLCEAIKQQWQLVLIVDDYTPIHRKRRPKTDQIHLPKSMCAIVIKVFKNVKAISKCVPATYHSIDGIEINSCVQTVSCPSSIYKLGFSYSSIMPGWVRNTFFNPELWRHRHSSAQFYSRQVVYEILQKYCHTINIDYSRSTTPSDYAYAMHFTSENPQESQVGISTNTNANQPAILSVIPCIGSIHNSLNGRETVFKCFRETALKCFIGFFEIIHN